MADAETTPPTTEASAWWCDDCNDWHYAVVCPACGFRDPYGVVPPAADVACPRCRVRFDVTGKEME